MEEKCEKVIEKQCSTREEMRCVTEVENGIEPNPEMECFPTLERECGEVKEEVCRSDLYTCTVHCTVYTLLCTLVLYTVLSEKNILSSSLLLYCTPVLQCRRGGGVQNCGGADVHGDYGGGDI